jgi:hypothetical protein
VRTERERIERGRRGTMIDQEEASVAFFFAFSMERRRFPILLELYFEDDMREPEEDLRGS